MLYVIHLVLGFIWWSIIMLGTSFMSSGTNYQGIGNPIIRSVYLWIVPGDILKNIIGIPLWIIFWPFELLAVVITNTFNW